VTARYTATVVDWKGYNEWRRILGRPPLSYPAYVKIVERLNAAEPVRRGTEATMQQVDTEDEQV
jgi:hypothetical protein